MAQPAFAAAGFSITEHRVVQIGDQAFKRAYMEKPLSLSHHPRAFNAEFHLYFTIANCEII